MRNVLVVDDLAVFREPIAAALRLQGYHTRSAADGAEALDLMRREPTHLVLLDVAMPHMDGLEFLRLKLADPALAPVPVILLTAVADKNYVLRARQLGVRDYLLKSHFSLSHLVERVESLAAESAESRPDPARPAPGPAQPPPAAAPAPKPPPRSAAPTDAPPSLLTREQTLARVETVTEAKTLAGSVAEVIRVASSPRADLTDLVDTIRRDPVIAARVLQVANSAAFMTQKVRIASLDDAARNIGLNQVRNIAASVGVFETFPPDSADGFNTVRCWQHHFAVAAILEKIQADSDESPEGIPHLIGLCHDLAEIVLRQHFAAEYEAVVRYSAASGMSIHEAEYHAFGLRHHELSAVILERLGLPPAIINPVRDFFDPAEVRREHVGLVRALKIADTYAHGLLLASSAEACVHPFNLADLRKTVGNSASLFDNQTLRSDVLTTTGLLARLSAADEARLMKPLVTRRPVSLWYARHPALAPIDPLANALEFMADVQVKDHLPARPVELQDCRAIVIATPRIAAGTFAPTEIDRILKLTRRENLPVLYLTARKEDNGPLPPNVSVLEYPTPLARLEKFINSLAAAAS